MMPGIRLKRWTRCFAAPLAVIALGAAVVCCGGNRSRAQQAEAFVVEPAPLDVSIREAGVLEATRVISIIPRYSGKIIALPETGAMVNAGDVVLALEDEEDITDLKDSLNELKTVKSELETSIESLQIALRSNRLDVDLADSQLSVQRARLEDVSTRLAETEVLLQQNIVPGEDLRDAQSRVSSNELNTLTRDLDLRGQVVDKQSSEANQLIQIQRKELQGLQARRRLDQMQHRIDQSTIRAPVSGMFLRKARWNWSTQSMTEPRPGDSARSGQVIGEIPDLGSLIVKSQIPESDLHRVRVGMAAEMSFDAYSGLRLTGTISEIGKVAIEREASAAGSLVQTSGYSGQKVFEIVLVLDQPDPRLKPGITTQVTILLERRQDVLAVPIEALSRSEGRNYVTVLDGNGLPERREVQLGLRNEEAVEVTSGLRAGERVAKTAAVITGVKRG